MIRSFQSDRLCLLQLPSISESRGNHFKISCCRTRTMVISSLSAAGRDMSPPLSGRNTTLSLRQKCFSDEARSEHVPDQSTSIASSVREGGNSHSALYLRCSNHASYLVTSRLTRLPADSYVAQDASKRNNAPDHARTTALQPSRLLPWLTSISSRVKRTIVGLRPRDRHFGEGGN